MQGMTHDPRTHEIFQDPKCPNTQLHQKPRIHISFRPVIPTHHHQRIVLYPHPFTNPPFLQVFKTSLPRQRVQLYLPTLDTYLLGILEPDRSFLVFPPQYENVCALDGAIGCVHGLGFTSLRIMGCRRFCGNKGLIVVVVCRLIAAMYRFGWMGRGVIVHHVVVSCEGPPSVISPQVPPQRSIEFIIPFNPQKPLSQRIEFFCMLLMVRRVELDGDMPYDEFVVDRPEWRGREAGILEGHVVNDWWGDVISVEGGKGRGRGDMCEVMGRFKGCWGILVPCCR